MIDLCFKIHIFIYAEKEIFKCLRYRTHRTFNIKEYFLKIFFSLLILYDKSIIQKAQLTSLREPRICSHHNDIILVLWKMKPLS